MPTRRSTHRRDSEQRAILQMNELELVAERSDELDSHESHKHSRKARHRQGNFNVKLEHRSPTSARAADGTSSDDTGEVPQSVERDILAVEDHFEGDIHKEDSNLDSNRVSAKTPESHQSKDLTTKSLTSSLSKQRFIGRRVTFNLQLSPISIPKSPRRLSSQAARKSETEISPETVVGSITKVQRNLEEQLEPDEESENATESRSKIDIPGGDGGTERKKENSQGGNDDEERDESDKEDREDADCLALRESFLIRTHSTLLPSRQTGDSETPSGSSDEELDAEHISFEHGEEEVAVHIQAQSQASSQPWLDDSVGHSKEVNEGWGKPGEESQNMTANSNDSWRPRRPTPSSLRNETQEDVYDDSSPEREPSPESIRQTFRRVSGLQEESLVRSRRTSSLNAGETVSEPRGHSKLGSPKLPRQPFSRSKSSLLPINSLSRGFPQHSTAETVLEEEEPDSPASQDSYVPSDSYFAIGSQTLQKPMSSPATRMKSTPDQSQLAWKLCRTRAHERTTTVGASAQRGSPQKSIHLPPNLTNAPQSQEKILVALTRHTSTDRGSVPSSRQRRLPSLPFVPPFKKLEVPCTPVCKL